MKDRFFLWQEAPGYCPFYLHGPMIGFFDIYRKELGVKLSNFSAFYKNNNVKFYVKEKEWHVEGLKAFERIKSDPAFVKKLFSIIEKNASELFRVSKKIQKKNLKELSDKQIYALTAEYYKIYTGLWSYGQIQNLPDFENDYVANHLMSWVDNRIREKKLKLNKTEAFAALVTPAKKGYAQKEEIDLMKLMAELQKSHEIIKILKKTSLKQVLKDLEKHPRELSLIKKHWQEYRWVQYNFLGPASTLEYYLEIIGGQLRQGVNPKKQLKQLAEKEAQLKKRQKELLRQLTPGPETRHLFDYARGVAWIKTVRMDASYFGYYVLEGICREIGKRLHLSLNQVRSIYFPELKGIFLERKYSIDKINERLKHGFIEGSAQSSRYTGGQEAKKRYAKLLANCRKEKKKNELRGSPAYPGTAIGKAKIILEAKDMIKMEKGDILVSAATSPDLLPAMKKAAAIITDTGGITCHAAIVSREMRTPCIIGLKSATKNFIDGDLLEIDANHGIARKVK